MAGRPPKPIEQHKLDGTYRKDRHSEHGIQNISKIVGIEPPEDLTEEARRVWLDIIPVLCAAELVTPIDMPALYEAFTVYGMAQELRKIAENKPKGAAAYVLSLGRMDKDPMFEYLRYMRRFDEILYKFGMTPVERARISTGKKERTNEDDPLSKIIGNG